jgi:hypothetical protein
VKADVRFFLDIKFANNQGVVSLSRIPDEDIDYLWILRRPTSRGFEIQCNPRRRSISVQGFDIPNAERRTYQRKGCNT